MSIECCEFESPLLIGDTAAVITITAGEPDDVTGVTISAEGCGCGYSDIYDDVYCDITDGGNTPNARVNDVRFTADIPAGHQLIIDSVEHTVRLVEEGQNPSIGGMDALEWRGIFEWIEAAKGGCARVCISGSGALTNPDTTVQVETYDREL